MANKPIVALLYDFDKTLCTTDMQNYSFIPALGMTPGEFWGATEEFSHKYGVERILSYMYMMVHMCKVKGIACTREYLKSQGQNIKYFDGVSNWFKRINEYGTELGLIVEHYLVSSGTKEIIDGCSIAKEFKAIFGCEFHYDEETGLPTWPKTAINYTAKTQYFFRISKGVLDQIDDRSVNVKTLNRRIPYRNIIYFGDGLTDVPIMILVKENGGNSIAVYQDSNKDHVSNLFEDGRVNYIARADYRSGSDIDKVIKLILSEISVQAELAKKQEQLLKK
ncbi:MAG: haloacid dehalogenase-like hydrolase [Bacilli bacterium]|nr:haloacid dehalogenase-like hydrolase [Bacilli bacterium]MDD4344906.1 haloacid dehalogenase-like hydrolase [Bacilli bacterium]MDD4521167.1 haloacid dehalogenase-like hydrolase [Bacilli bacterium]MDY0399551.1 haloacid dehalogenase-like hydrolase [Bacilli bacterium]HKM10907.1 haloacid dehalogenase-like hydrolase [Bacilli bacterium]